MMELEYPARRLLVRAGQLAAGRVTPTTLRCALDAPALELPRAADVYLDGPTLRLLARAETLATADGRRSVAEDDIYEALLEAEARALGLDLNRLRFARYLAQRGRPAADAESVAPAPPARQVETPATPTPADRREPVCA